MHRTQRKQLGFTLLELMTALAVLAVLLGVGVPAFTSIIRNNQIAAKSNDLMVALTFARSEAVKRGERVSVCALASGPPAPACDNTAGWSNGWLVFQDDFGAAGVFDPSDTLLQSSGAAAGGVTITAADVSQFSVTFARTGRAEFQRSFTVTKNGCTDNQARSMAVDLSGRVSLMRVACP